MGTIEKLDRRKYEQVDRWLINYEDPVKPPLVEVENYGEVIKFSTEAFIDSPTDTHLKINSLEAIRKLYNIFGVEETRYEVKQRDPRSKDKLDNVIRTNHFDFNIMHDDVSNGMNVIWQTEIVEFEDRGYGSSPVITRSIIGCPSDNDIDDPFIYEVYTYSVGYGGLIYNSRDKIMNYFFKENGKQHDIRMKIDHNLNLRAYGAENPYAILDEKDRQRWVNQRLETSDGQIFFKEPFIFTKEGVLFETEDYYVIRSFGVKDSVAIITNGIYEK